MRMSMLQRLMIGSAVAVALLCGGMAANAAQDVFLSQIGWLDGGESGPASECS